MTTSIQTVIKDAETGKELPINIDINEQGIFIGAKGYGEKSGNSPFATPIMVEYDHGELRVIAWSDINSEDPTHLIDMRKARESNRDEE